MEENSRPSSRASSCFSEAPSEVRVHISDINPNKLPPEKFSKPTLESNDSDTSVQIAKPQRKKQKKKSQRLKEPQITMVDDSPADPPSLLLESNHRTNTRTFN